MVEKKKATVRTPGDADMPGAEDHEAKTSLETSSDDEKGSGSVSDEIEEGAAAPLPTSADESIDDLSEHLESKADVPDSEDAIPQSTPIPAREETVVRKGGVWPMFLGGVIAAAIGAGAILYLAQNGYIAQQAIQGDELTDARILALDKRISALEANLDALSARPDADKAIEGLGASLTSMTGRIASLEDSVSELALRPQGSGEADSATIEAMRSELEQLNASVREREEAAQQKALSTLRQALAMRLLTLIETGGDIGPVLADLREANVEIPAPLSDVETSGVTGQEALVAEFPEVARRALEASRGSGGGATPDFGAFLKSQLGIRSLTPREGDDPDAVLSRAEAHLREGRLEDALAELNGLPEPAQSVTSDWIAKATQRKDALSAAKVLVGTLE